MRISAETLMLWGKKVNIKFKKKQHKTKFSRQIGRVGRTSGEKPCVVDDLFLVQITPISTSVFTFIVSINSVNPDL